MAATTNDSTSSMGALSRVLRSIAAGSGAAATATIFSNPVDVIKTRMQLQGELGRSTGRQYTSAISGMRQIFAEEGIRGIQAGLAPAMMFQLALNGVRLGAFPYLNSAFHQLYGVRHSVSESDHGRSAAGHSVAVAARLSAGLTSGVIGGALGHPLYLVKNRLQSIGKGAGGFTAVHKYDYKGPMDGLRRIYLEEGGFRALFRGVDAAVMRVGAGSAAQLASYETFKELFAGFGASGILLHTLASAGASVVITTIMAPFDVVSTRYMQSQKGSGHYSSPLDCFVKTARAEGARNLWRGAGALYLRLAPHTVLTFTFLEQFRLLLGVA